MQQVIRTFSHQFRSAAGMLALVLFVAHLVAGASPCARTADLSSVPANDARPCEDARGGVPDNVDMLAACSTACMSIEGVSGTGDRLIRPLTSPPLASVVDDRTAPSRLADETVPDGPPLATDPRLIRSVVLLI